MEISYVTAPVIGAIIGYSTNWLAIKMMFRPRKEIKLGKITLPFTPGIIPKNRKNIAHAISSTIANNLLTSEDLKKTLLSSEMKENLKVLINNKINEMAEYKVNDVLIEYIDRDNLNKLYDFLLDKGTKKILQSIKEKDLVHIISEQVKNSIEEKIKGTVFSIIGSKKIIESLSKNIEDNVNEFIETNGEKIIYEMIEKEINKILEKKVEELDINIDFSAIIVSMYEKIVIDNIEEILKSINIEKMIEDKINSMDMIELEKLILKIMKKELNAVISLGAVIGFILGLFNIIF